MNPQTGEILAMVSLPAYDNNKFAAGISADDYAVYLSDPAKPLRNHAIADIYPPGSTFKLVTGLAALEEGVTTAGRPWPTYGCYQIPDAPKGQCLFDWNHAGFGPLNMTQAYAKSSDTFFYQMAVGLGVDRLGEWAKRLGFGEQSGIRLPGEADGIIASREWARSQGRADVFTGELAQAGIGQNVMAVTPLQLLNAYAALANGGRLMRADDRPRRDGRQRQADQGLQAAGHPAHRRQPGQPADHAHRRARGHHHRACLQHPRPAAAGRADRQDRHRRVRRPAARASCRSTPGSWPTCRRSREPPTPTWRS